MRGRNPENPNSRIKGDHFEQRLELNMNGMANTITTVQKDNLLLEEIKEMSETNERFFKQADETFMENECKPGDTINAFNKTVDQSGTSPTLTTRPEGFKTAILPVVEKEKEEPKTKTMKTVYKIRKLTPKECFRLMDVTDKDADAMLSVNSNSQCYKQAGNSIVVACLIGLFSQLHIKGVKTWNEGLYKDLGYDFETVGGGAAQ